MVKHNLMYKAKRFWLNLTLRKDSMAVYFPESVEELKRLLQLEEIIPAMIDISKVKRLDGLDGAFDGIGIVKAHAAKDAWGLSQDEFNRALMKSVRSDVRTESDANKDNSVGSKQKEDVLKTVSVSVESMKKYHPKTRDELKKLCDDPKISLKDIDVSKVDNFEKLFFRSTRSDFSGIEDWDVSHVKNFKMMFQSAKNFNADLSKWDTKSATNMRSMFAYCKTFAHDVSHFDISNIKKFDAGYSAAMIKNCTALYCLMDERYEKLSLDVKDVKDRCKTENIKKYCPIPILKSFEYTTWPKHENDLTEALAFRLDRQCDYDFSKVDVSEIRSLDGVFDCSFTSGEAKLNLKGVEKWKPHKLESMRNFCHDIHEGAMINISGWGNLPNLTSVEGAFTLERGARECGFTFTVEGLEKVKMPKLVNATRFCEGASINEDALKVLTKSKDLKYVNRCFSEVQMNVENKNSKAIDYINQIKTNKCLDMVGFLDIYHPTKEFSQAVLDLDISSCTNLMDIGWRRRLHLNQGFTSYHINQEKLDNKLDDSLSYEMSNINKIDYGCLTDNNLQNVVIAWNKTDFINEDERLYRHKTWPGKEPIHAFLDSVWVDKQNDIVFKGNVAVANVPIVMLKEAVSNDPSTSKLEEKEAIVKYLQEHKIAVAENYEKMFKMVASDPDKISLGKKLSGQELKQISDKKTATKRKIHKR